MKSLFQFLFVKKNIKNPTKVATNCAKAAKIFLHLYAFLPTITNWLIKIPKKAAVR